MTEDAQGAKGEEETARKFSLPIRGSLFRLARGTGDSAFSPSEGHCVSLEAVPRTKGGPETKEVMKAKPTIEDRRRLKELNTH